MARVFVTGASGFVGRHLVARLTSHGHAVRALLRRAIDLGAGVTPVRGSLEDVSGFGPALRQCDAVIHAAAALPPVSDARAEAVNRQATRELAAAAVDAGVRLFVFVSSVAAIGFRDLGLVGPEVACRPETAYGRSKRAAERDLLALDAPLRVVIVRPPTVYGPGDRGNFLLLTRRIERGFFVLPGGGDNRMSFCHVDNLVSALYFALECPQARAIFHVDDGRPVSLREAVETIAAALGRRVVLLPLPMPAARAAALGCELLGRLWGIEPPLTRSRLRTVTSDFALDGSRLRQLGWSPPIAFAAGVGGTVGWYRAQRLL
jgi:UDP-glucose 4-epimerase